MFRTEMLWCVGFATAISLFGGAICQAMSTSTAKNGIEQALRERTAAHDRKDLEGYLKSFSMDYVAENVVGAKTAYPRLRSSMTYNFAHSIMGSTQYNIMGVRVDGGTVKVTLMALYTYPPSVQSKSRAHVYKRTIAEEIWVDKGNQWQETHEQYLLDEQIFSKTPLTLGSAI